MSDHKPKESTSARHRTTVENPSSDFSSKLASLRNPEARKVVNDFQKNVYDLLVNKSKWRVRPGSGAIETTSLNSDATPTEKQETFRYEDEVFKKFATSLVIKDEEENGCTPGSKAAALGPPVMFEVDDGGQMEFNPFKLVATLGQKLTLAAQLMEVIRDEREKEILAEQMQDKGAQADSNVGASLNGPENTNFSEDQENNKYEE